MGSLNVNRSVSDAFYRYKMPRIMAKVEGKGNGIKTVIVNMMEVAKALGRPPTYPTKYFGCELGAQTQFDFKNDRFIVNGSHDAAKLQDLLDGFIRKFVLCPECDNPETTLLISSKKGSISQSCKACGHHGPLEFNHKLNTFILKNPPNLNPAVQGSSLTEGKRSKRSKKATPETNGDGRSSPKSDESDSDKFKINAPSEKSNEEEDDETWAVDVSEEAVKARQQDLTDGVKGLMMNDDLEKTEKILFGFRFVVRSSVFMYYYSTVKPKNLPVFPRPQNTKLRTPSSRLGTTIERPEEDLIFAEIGKGEKDISLNSSTTQKERPERIDLFYNYMKKMKDNGSLDNHREIVAEAERLEIKPKATLVLAELLFDQNIHTQAKKHRVLLLRFTHEDSKAQKCLIGGIEQTIALHQDVLLPKVPAIFKLFYDLDILEEKVLLEWSEKVSKKHVSKELSQEIHTRVKPFISWLKEAEEESESESEDDVEIEYDDRAKASPLKEQPKTAKPAVIEDEVDDDDDELNIDDI